MTLDFRPLSEELTMFTKLVVGSVILLHLTACAPATQLRRPATWPPQWAGRSLWTTPHAHVYASHAAAAGELDRLTIRVKDAYVHEVHGPTPLPLIVVRDIDEDLPVSDADVLLRHSLRFSAAIAVDQPESAEALEAGVEGAMTGVTSSAAACGTDAGVLMAMTPLLCDAVCLRELSDLPDDVLADVKLAIILPTRACIRHNTNRMVAGALKMYGIGPIARIVFAPVLALAKGKMVEQMALLRDAALYNFWLMEHPDLSPAEKRAHASAYLERWGADAQAGAATVAKAAVDTAGSLSEDRSD